MQKLRSISVVMMLTASGLVVACGGDDSTTAGGNGGSQTTTAGRGGSSTTGASGSNANGGAGGVLEDSSAAAGTGGTTDDAGTDRGAIEAGTGGSGDSGTGVSCDSTHLCVAGYCVVPAGGTLGTCKASCPPGQGWNSNKICFGPCGTAAGFTCLDGVCSDPASGHCADNSTCPDPKTQGVDANGVCGGTCSASQGCAQKLCDDVSKTCVVACPANEGVSGTHCVFCPSGQGVGSDHTCGGKCDFGKTTNRCLTGYCESFFTYNICIISCQNEETPNTNGDCSGACVTGRDCTSGVCTANGCATSCFGGYTLDSRGTCGGSCSATDHCQSGYCVPSIEGSHVTGTCMSSCGSNNWGVNADGICGGQCYGAAGNIHGSCTTGHCAQPNPTYNFCVLTCPNSQGVDHYGLCGGQCGGTGSMYPVCLSGCCTSSVEGTCKTGTETGACGASGSVCSVCPAQRPICSGHVCTTG